MDATVFYSYLGSWPDDYAADGWSIRRIRDDLRARGHEHALANHGMDSKLAAYLEELGLPMTPGAIDTLTLTTVHAASSYGVPVLVVDGEAYGPADIVPGTGLTAVDLLREWARRFVNVFDEEEA